MRALKILLSREGATILAFCFFAFSLSFGISIASVSLGFLLLLLLRSASGKQRMERSRWAIPATIVFIAIFSCETLPALFSANGEWGQLDKKLAFLLLPLLLWFSSIQVDDDLVRKTYRWFVLGNVFSGLVCLGIAIWRSCHFQDGSWHFDSSVWGNTPVLFSIDHFGNYFFAEHFAYFNHPSYWGVSILFCLILLVDDRGAFFVFKKSISTVIILFLVLLIFLISSRLVLLLFILMVLVHFALRASALGGMRMAGLVGVLILLGSITYNHPRVRSSIDALLSSGVSVEKRSASWSASIAVISEAPFLGWGPESMEMMKRAYAEMGALENLRLELNAHNQFLESWMFAGVAGLLSVVCLVSLGFHEAWSRRSKLLFSFCFVIVVFFMFESVFGRFQGVSFVTFFFSLHFFKAETKVE